jgi:hypothetical protein
MLSQDHGKEVLKGRQEDQESRKVEDNTKMVKTMKERLQKKRT